MTREQFEMYMNYKQKTCANCYNSEDISEEIGNPKLSVILCEEMLKRCISNNKVERSHCCNLWRAL
jgi:hypothetical protein